MSRFYQTPFLYCPLTNERSKIWICEQDDHLHIVLYHTMTVATVSWFDEAVKKLLLPSVVLRRKMHHAISFCLIGSTFSNHLACALDKWKRKPEIDRTTLLWVVTRLRSLIPDKFFDSFRFIGVAAIFRLAFLYLSSSSVFKYRSCC